MNFAGSQPPTAPVKGRWMKPHNNRFYTPMETDNKGINPLATDGLYAPMRFTKEPIVRLLLMAFPKNHQDTVYSGFEPQVVRNPLTGRESLLVIGYRKDKYLDIYHQADYRPLQEKYRKVHKGAKGLYPREFEGGYFRADGKGMNLLLTFKDAEDRDITIRVKNQPSPNCKAVQMLAPVGSSAVEPNEMMLVFMDNFFFVTQKQGEATVQIDAEVYQMPRKGPLPLGTMQCTKYCLSPITCNMNPALQNETLPLLRVENGTVAHLNDSRYRVRVENGRVLTEAIELAFDEHTMQCRFAPPLPDVRALQPGNHTEGSFTIDMGEALGNVSGEYQYSRKGDGVIHLSVRPCHGWKLGEKCNRTIFLWVAKFVKIFTSWPKSYLWKAVLTPRGEGFSITSNWVRVK